MNIFQNIELGIFSTKCFQIFQARKQHWCQYHLRTEKMSKKRCWAQYSSREKLNIICLCSVKWRWKSSGHLDHHLNICWVTMLCLHFVCILYAQSKEDKNLPDIWIIISIFAWSLYLSRAQKNFLFCSFGNFSDINSIFCLEGKHCIL